MTTGDVQSSSSTRRSGSGGTKKRKSRRKKGGGAFFCGPKFIGLAIVSLGLLLVAFLLNAAGLVSFGGRSGASGTDDAKSGSRKISFGLNKAKRHESPLPLERFQSLSYALANADLVGLYFAASWCPMSTPVTEALKDAFLESEGKFLSPPGSEEAGGDEDLHRTFALVYVSSDKTEEDMVSYAGKNWINVPFGSDERPELKKHFRTCARIELEELGIDRKNEIPTLIIIDSATHGILSADGASDIKEYKEKALDHWLELQQLMRSLEDKYARGGHG